MDPKNEIEYEAPSIEDRKQVEGMLGAFASSKKALRHRRKGRRTLGMRAASRMRDV